MAKAKRPVGASIERARELCAGLFAQLERDNALLRDTLDNMTQGVLMFDPDRTIVVSNRRYLEMYGLSGEIVRPGCSLRELLEHRKASGSLALDIEIYLQRIDDLLETGETTEMLVDTGDGRTIHVVTQPLPDRGWVATHEDITERLALDADGVAPTA